MSTDLVEFIHVRLREELDRLGLKLAAASRAANEVSPQRLKDVVSGRQKCPAELIAKLVGTGVDVMYILTGARTQPAHSELTSDEEVLLEEYRALDRSNKKRVLASMLVGGRDAPEESRQNTQTVSGSGHRVAGRDFITKE